MIPRRLAALTLPFLICLAAATADAGAAGWIDGPIAYQSGTTFQGNVTSTFQGSFVGYTKDGNTADVRAGEVYYLRVYSGQIANPPAGYDQFTHSLTLPQNTQLAISSENPVQCAYLRNGSRPGDNVWVDVTTDTSRINANCPRNATQSGANVNLGWRLLPAFTEFQIHVPVVTSSAMSGASPSHRATATVTTVLGHPNTVSASVGVTVGSGSTQPPPPPPPPTEPPANLTAPYFTGSLEVGQQVTCNPGSWTGEPRLRYSIRFTIPGAPGAPSLLTNPTQTVPAGATAIACTVTGTNDFGTASRTVEAPISRPSDPDQDGDGVPDARDNCTATPNPDQRDADGDGRGAACDADDGGTKLVAPDGDGDGVPDERDNCPAVANADQRDADGDGRGAACDPDDGGTKLVAPDGDGDGVPDARDNCPSAANADQRDADGDGRGGACDPDDGKQTTQVPKAGKCSKLKGKKRSACIKRACGNKRGAKKRTCVKAVTRRGRGS